VTSRAQQVLDLYRGARVEDQLGYYEQRRSLFERAHGELLVLSAVLLGATSTVSGLAGVNISGKLVWAILAAVLPALSTLLAAYSGLFGFDRNAKLYADASRNLALLDQPGAGDEAPGDDAVAGYVQQAEDVFQKEQSQWGQLASERAAGSEPGAKAQT
jgi:conflict system pore-forming effector with SLATT domain